MVELYFLSHTKITMNTVKIGKIELAIVQDPFELIECITDTAVAGYNFTALHSIAYGTKRFSNVWIQGKFLRRRFQFVIKRVWTNTVRDLVKHTGFSLLVFWSFSLLYESRLLLFPISISFLLCPLLDTKSHNIFSSIYEAV